MNSIMCLSVLLIDFVASCSLVTSGVGRQIACRWNLIALHLVRTWCNIYMHIQCLETCHPRQEKENKVGRDESCAVFEAHFSSDCFVNLPPCDLLCCDLFKRSMKQVSFFLLSSLSLLFLTCVFHLHGSRIHG